jgi:hypothetical protein
MLVAVVKGEAAFVRPNEAQSVDQARGSLLPRLSGGQVVTNRGGRCGDTVQVGSMREVPVS